MRTSSGRVACAAHRLLREEHWAIVDLLGKAGHIRTVPILGWVKVALDEWKEAAAVMEGALFRSINKTGRVGGLG
jgi:hypothetical protein